MTTAIYTDYWTRTWAPMRPHHKPRRFRRWQRRHHV